MPALHPTQHRSSKLARYVASLWTISLSNLKTGPVPTQYVGKDDQQLRRSCAGCALAPWSDGGCYFHSGNGIRGAHSVQRSALPKDLHSVLDRSYRGTRVARFGAGGDPARVNPHVTAWEIETITEALILPIGYSHFPHEIPLSSPAHQVFLASCETLEDAARLNDEGRVVALAGPSSAPEGYEVCANAIDPSITCNTCPEPCNAAHMAARGVYGKVFPAHGGGAKRLPLAGVSF